MEEYDRVYNSFKLPPRKSVDNKTQSSFRQDSTGAFPMKGSQEKEVSLAGGTYYEIEYDATPMPGVGKFVLKTQKIETPEKDEIRELFDRMRDIARSNRYLVYGSSKFYNEKVRQEKSRIFYKQGMFMKDFEDDYEEAVPYKEYFPYYQMMGYRQLRTYFTWRTQVRKGKVEKTSLSYCYLYLYELLSNIGISDPQEGLDKLLFFWREFREYEPSIDKYVMRWLKDYHIYYDLPQPFPEFVWEKGLTEHYPDLTGPKDRFALFCTLSKYDISKSVFYTEDRETLIRDCFEFTLDRLTMIFSEHGIDLESVIFLPVKSRVVWRPFQEALFFPWRQQRDRSVVLSPKEIYVCSQNQWIYQTALTAESGRQLVGYILKQMEATLRQAVNYKYRLTAGISMLHPMTVKRLEDAGIALEQSITDAVKEFYRETTKTVVSVDREILAKIRREALQTQEKLLVPEDENAVFMPFSPAQEMPSTYAPAMSVTFASVMPLQSAQKTCVSVGNIDTAHLPMSMSMTESMNMDIVQESIPQSAHLEQEQENPWKDFKLALTKTEQEALLLILSGGNDTYEETGLKQFADTQGIMLEVLADGINEKAVDIVGDSLLDEEFNVYDDYLGQVREALDI